MNRTTRHAVITRTIIAVLPFIGFFADLATCAEPQFLTVQTAKPNLLFILTDDQRTDCIRALNPYIHTPNIDRLARQGVLFNNCYFMGGNTPAVCTPSRVMLMSGRTLFHLPRGHQGARQQAFLRLLVRLVPDALPAGRCADSKNCRNKKFSAVSHRSQPASSANDVFCLS